jgi:hypothetical protein
METTIQYGGVIGYRKKPKTVKKCLSVAYQTPNLKQYSITCFKTFTSHSSIRLIGQGTYGKAFLLTIKNPEQSPYIDIEGRPVKVMLVKVGLIRTNSARPVSSANGITPTTIDDFKEESQTQERIFRMSLKKYNSALCPAIVYIDIITSKQFQTLYPKLFHKIEKENSYRFSLIGMETFERVDNVLNYGLSKSLQDTIVFLLIRLAALGVAHGDPSKGNVILDKDTGRPFLIDFGNVQRLTEAETAFMQTQVANITDKTRVLNILLKGFAHEHPDMPNWDWLKHIKDIKKPNAELISSFVDKNWSTVLLG